MPSNINKHEKKTGKRRVAGWFLEFLISAIVIWVILAIAGHVLPKIALKQISTLTNTDIEAASLDFRFDGSVYIRELIVRPHESANYDNSILKAETVRVHFGLGSLIRFRPRLREIFVDNFVLRAQYDIEASRWNLAALRIEIPGGGKGRLPRIWLENGHIEYSKVVGGRVRVVASSPVSVGFRPAQKLIGGYSFDISSAGRQNFEKSAIFGSWRPGRITLGGRLSSNDVPGFERPWILKSLNTEITYEPNNSFILRAEVTDFTCPPSELRNLFAFDTAAIADKVIFVNALQEFFSKYGPSGKIDIDMLVSGNLAKLGDSTIKGTVSCKEAAVCDKNFAYEVEHITGQINLTEKSAKLKDMKGRHGGVGLTFEGYATASEPKWEYGLQIASDNMMLDEDLYNALNGKEQKLWSSFSPSGMASIRYSRSNKPGEDMLSSLVVQLLNVDAKYTEFSYPLKNTQGTLDFTADGIEFSDVVSQWGGRKITINGKAGMAAGEPPEYDFLINAQNVPLDEMLEEALPATQREFYNQFEMMGRIDANIHVVSFSGGGQDNNTFTAEIYPKGSTLAAKVFPLAISDVTGKMVVKPELVDIEGLSGRYASGSVSFSGLIWPGGEVLDMGRQSELGYCLSMRAKQVELDEDLIGTLPGSLGVLLKELRPGGEVNFIADVSRNPRGKCNENRLIIECLNSTIDCNLLPYPLRDISGRIGITQDGIEFDNVTATASNIIQGQPVQSLLRMSGNIIPGSNGDDNIIQISGGVVNISGENVRLKGKTLSRLDTTIAYDAESGQWLSRYFVADFYDGKMTGKLRLNKSNEGSFDYMLDARVAGADLKQFLSDTPNASRPEDHYSTGSINGSLSIISSIVNNDIKVGRCRIKITDMEAGKLSPLAKLLQVLNLREPSDYAFDQMTVDAYIQDNKMFFRQLDLSGQSLAFYGSGRLDLENDNINLTLTARSRRVMPANPSVWESLTEGLGRGVVRVEVKGEVNDPQITIRPLPVIKETLEILGTPRH